VAGRRAVALHAEAAEERGKGVGADLVRGEGEMREGAGGPAAQRHVGEEKRGVRWADRARSR
jgi:hypothetical protein